MLSQTLVEGLKRYSIGEKLRSLRLKKKMGLVELGRHTGLSPALLSKVERDKLFPTLPTLLRIALVFGVGLEYFFSGEDQRHPVVFVRARDRKRFPERPGAKDVSYHFECLDFPAVERKLSAYYAEFHPMAAGKVKLHQHPGIEFLYVLQGRLGLNIRGDETQMAARDSVYFDSTLPHGYRRMGRQPCTALVVTVP